jgi:type II secretory pathway pseudopilin PulG
MLNRPRSIPAVLAEERGFTLVELLVVILAGVVVTSALMTILVVSLRGTTRTISRVDATRQGRIALANIEDELHSSCAAPGVVPVKAGSSGTSITFVSAYGTAASPTPVQHTISLNSGKLTDATYAMTGGTAPNWTFSSTPSITRVLATNAAQSGSTPIFQYFAFDIPTNSSGVPYTDAAGNSFKILLDGTSPVPGTTTIPANAPSPLATPLSTTDAQRTAEVLITLVVKPGGGSFHNTNLVPNTLTDSVVLRLTPVPNHVTDAANFAPCA